MGRSRRGPRLSAAFLPDLQPGSPIPYSRVFPRSFRWPFAPVSVPSGEPEIDGDLPPARPCPPINSGAMARNRPVSNRMVETAAAMRLSFFLPSPTSDRVVLPRDILEVLLRFSPECGFVLPPDHPPAWNGPIPCRAALGRFRFRSLCLGGHTR